MLEIYHEARSAVAKAKSCKPISHGLNCSKSPHIGDGHLHGEDDDTPYMVDGLSYCGRCHGSMEAVRPGKIQCPNCG